MEICRRRIQAATAPLSHESPQTRTILSRMEALKSASCNLLSALPLSPAQSQVLTSLRQRPPMNVLPFGCHQPLRMTSAAKAKIHRSQPVEITKWCGSKPDQSQTSFKCYFNIISIQSVTFTPKSSSKLHVFYHDSDTFGMDRTQPRILKQTHHVGF